MITVKRTRISTRIRIRTRTLGKLNLFLRNIECIIGGFVLCIAFETYILFVDDVFASWTRKLKEGRMNTDEETLKLKCYFVINPNQRPVET